MMVKYGFNSNKTKIFLNFQSKNAGYLGMGIGNSTAINLGDADFIGIFSNTEGTYLLDKKG